MLGTLWKCRAGVQGGCISSSGVELLSVAFSHFERNTCPAGTGGALYIAPFTRVTLANSTFVRNDADYSGAVHLVPDATLEPALTRADVTGCEFAYNNAWAAGGALGFGTMPGMARIIRSQFHDNSITSNGEGGALLLQLTIVNGTFITDLTNVRAAGSGRGGDGGGEGGEESRMLFLAAPEGFAFGRLACTRPPFRLPACSPRSITTRPRTVVPSRRCLRGIPAVFSPSSSCAAFCPSSQAIGRAAWAPGSMPRAT